MFPMGPSFLTLKGDVAERLIAPALGAGDARSGPENHGRVSAGSPLARA